MPLEGYDSAGRGGGGSSDVAAVPADGWKQVASVSHDTVGGTILSVQWTLSATVVGGGKARALISGGSFGAGLQVGPELSLDVLASAHAHASSFAPVQLPVTAGTTYTVAIQVQAVGDGASVTVNAASSPSTNGARVALVEYH